MQLFLRKLKRSVFTRGRYKIYIFLALGELILVVAGILIAVKIDNWNESKKELRTEINTLKEIHASLKISRDNLVELNKSNKRWLSYNKKILNYLEQKKPYDKSLDVCFGTYYWSGKAQLTTAAYAQLKNKGLDIITNKEIRRDIMYIFEDYFGQVKTEHEEWDNQYLSSVIYPEHIKLFQKYYPDSASIFSDEYARPNNYQALLQNQKFENIIAENISLRRWSILFKEGLIGKIDLLNSDIQEEIEKLENQ